MRAQCFWQYAMISSTVIPSTPGGFTIGHGRTVRGTTEAIALWLAGRKGVDAELQFS